jgi:hypothetical protein
MSKSNSIYIVYQTTNLVNQKIYIGVHKQKFHFPVLFDGYLGSGKLLRQSIKKYGINSFKRETLFVFDNRESAYLKEKKIVNEEFVKQKNTYNMGRGGVGGCVIKHTKEARKKISDAGKNRIWSEETRKKISNASKGRIISEEQKEAISKRFKGKKQDKDFIIRRTKSFKGRNITWSDKISKAHLNVPKSEEHKKSLSLSKKGKKKMHNKKLKINKFIFPSEIQVLLDQGWEKGFIKF